MLLDQTLSSPSVAQAGISEMEIVAIDHRWTTSDDPVLNRGVDDMEMQRIGIIACTLLAAMSSNARAQAAAEVSPRIRMAQIEDERDRLAAEHAAIARQSAGPANPADGNVASNKDVGASARTFAGLRLGIGLSFTLDTGKLDRISEARVVDNVVRVTDQNNGRARIMLESHYFFTPCGDFLGIEGLIENEDQKPNDGRCNSGDPKRARWGWGPFVAVQPGSGEIIDAIGMGVMFGFRRDMSSTQSFNLGFGIVVDPNTRVLGDGFRENEPPPGEEMEVRYRETLQTGFLILTSFSF